MALQRNYNQNKSQPILKDFCDAILRYGIVETAHASGVPESTIRGYVTYGVVPSLTNAAKICNAIGYDLRLINLWAYDN